MSAEISLPGVCDSIVLSEEQIARRVRELGAAIQSDHAGRDLRFVTVLRGSLFFLADLVRSVDAHLTFDFLAVSAFVPGRGGVVRVTKDLSDDIAGADVVLVEDIIDTGLTANYLLSLLRAHQPRTLQICTLLDKPARRIADVPISYRGFEMPDRFLVGYGLDLNQRYRNLPYVATLRDDAVLG